MLAGVQASVRRQDAQSLVPPPTSAHHQHPNFAQIVRHPDRTDTFRISIVPNFFCDRRATPNRTSHATVAPTRTTTSVTDRSVHNSRLLVRYAISSRRAAERSVILLAATHVNPSVHSAVLRDIDLHLRNSGVRRIHDAQHVDSAPFLSLHILRRLPTTSPCLSLGLDCRTTAKQAHITGRWSVLLHGINASAAYYLIRGYRSNSHIPCNISVRGYRPVADPLAAITPWWNPDSTAWQATGE